MAETPYMPDPFTAMGGGVYVNGGWVPKDHPVALQHLAKQQQKPVDRGILGEPSGPPGSTPKEQAGYAQTYSATPGAAPTATTANQGTQDVVRNTYLQRATQGTTIDRNAPEFRQQVEPYAAGQERARRQYESEQAERLAAKGLGSSGALEQERRFAAERSGQATGMFESQLVTRELENRRNEIREALTSLGGMISADQVRDLQRDLADVDAALKREGLSQSGALGGRELDIKDKLGTGALNVDLMRALLQNQQFGTDAGIRVGELEARYAPWL